MLPINLLQSQLAHNKKRINELQLNVHYDKQEVRRINKHIKELSGVALAQEYVVTMTCQKLECLKELQKTRKQLKQLAILQKSIKKAIHWRVAQDSYLLHLALKDQEEL